MNKTMMNKTMILLYGVVAYGGFLGALLYLIGFVGGFAVPKDINDGAFTPWPMAVTINLALILAFGLQHTIMARPGFKKAFARRFPASVERSTFVLATCGVLALLYWQWRPMELVVWQLDGVAARALMYSLFAVGWLTVLYASFLINHFDLFGLRQVFLAFRGRAYSPVPMKVVSLYRLVRNPLMLGFLIAFWATPHMTAGHLLFALGMTGYILMGIHFEERKLARELGEVYRAYQKRTPMLLPIGAAPGTDSGHAREIPAPGMGIERG